MNPSLISKALVLLLAASGILSLVLWIGTEPRESLAERIPGSDRGGMDATARTAAAAPAGRLERSTGTPADLPGAWPRFRGARFDNISEEDFEPALKENNDALQVLWEIEVGEGHAGAAVLDGRVYVLDYDREKEEDALRCLSLADGQEIWRYAYPVKVKRNHGMSRTVPAVTEKYLLSFGPKCHVTCLDPKTGELFWQKDLVQAFKTKVPPWYAGQCPLIDGDRAILAPGGTALMAAFHLRSGELLWETPNPRAWKMTHVSIIPMEFAGRSMYLYCGSGGVAGVSAEDGGLLFETGEWKIKIAAVPSPVVVGEGLIFLCGGYEAGSMMLRLKEEGGALVPEPVFRLGHKVFGSAQQTPIFFEGHIYGVRPDEQLVCLDLEGHVVWASGSAHKFGLGPYLLAHGMLYVMNDSGLLSLVEAAPGGFRLVARTRVLEGHDSWGPMALAGGRLIVRDLTRMKCLQAAVR